MFKNLHFELKKRKLLFLKLSFIVSEHFLILQHGQFLRNSFFLRIFTSKFLVKSVSCKKNVYRPLRRISVQKDVPRCRSNYPELFPKKGVPKNFAKFTGKHLCQILFFNKVAKGQRPATLLKKRLQHWCFPVNFAKLLRTPFSIKHLWWLLLQTR